MSCGLVSLDGWAVPLEKVECVADVMGEYGFYTLKQSYINSSDSDISVRYVFPIPSAGAVHKFSAKINEVEYYSSIVALEQAEQIQKQNQGTISLKYGIGGALEVFIGLIPQNAKVEITIWYLCTTKVHDNSVRLIIPTVIAPRYVTWGGQVALESVLMEAKYNVSLSLSYKGKDIAGISSPTHDINWEIGSRGALASLKSPTSPDRDIIIDITLMGKNRPVMYFSKNIAYYSFTPKIDLYKRSPRNYIFMLDVSSSMEGEKIRQAKNAIEICIRCLQEKDTFNIIAFQTYYTSLSDEPLKVSNASLGKAKKWLKGLLPQGGTEMYHPIKHVCDGGKDSTILLFTDGQIADYDTIVKYASKQGGIFYTFGIDSAVNSDFLIKLANATGGLSFFITPSERVDEGIVRAFNKIAVHTVKNAVVNFDVPALSVTPKVIKQIHAGERVTIMAKFPDTPPRQLTLTGDFAGVKMIMQVQFENPSMAGNEIEYFFAKAMIDNLKNSLTGDIARDSAIQNQIQNLSIKHGILTEKTAFVIKTGLESKTKIVETIIPSALPYGWETNIVAFREVPKRKNETDGFLKIMKTQRADGSFYKAGHDVVDYTAHILSTICKDCKKADMFIWQLRKAVNFILSALQKGSFGVIPENIVNSLEIWYKKFGANDEISQKVGALVYLYRKNE